MRSALSASASRTAAYGLALALGLALAGCGGVPTNRSMNSVHQPVVERVDYTLDVNTSGSGLAYGEQGRVAEWFDALDLKYGDRITIDDPSGSPATRSTVEALASRHGILLGGQPAPQTADYVAAGTARVIVTRSKASVPGCPDWSTKSDFNPNNGLSGNYGCATNVNLAAMIANPEDLIRGAEDTGATSAATATKAINAYRTALPTGGGNTVSSTGSKGN